MKDYGCEFRLSLKSSDLEISRYRLTDYVKELYLSACRTCSTISFPRLTNQIWRRRPCLSSLISRRDLPTLLLSSTFEFGM